MLESEMPAYLCLTLRSCDDDIGATHSWRGLVGGREPLLVVVTLAYDDKLAKLAKLARISLVVGHRERLFALLSCEPTSKPVAPKLTHLPGHVPAEPSEPLPRPGWSVSMGFEASGQLAQDFNRLVEQMSLRSNTQQLALGSAGRLCEN